MRFLWALASGVSGRESAGFLRSEADLDADLARLRFQPRTKRVIFVLMAVGPSHIEVLDSKPAMAKSAGQRSEGVALCTERVTGGLLPSPLEFRKCGESVIEVSELVPHLRGGRR